VPAGVVFRGVVIVCKAAVGCIVSEVEWRLEVCAVNGGVVKPGS